MVFMFSCLHDHATSLANSLQSLEIAPPGSTGVSHGSTVSKVALLACFKAMQIDDSLIPPLWELVADYTVAALSNRLLDAALAANDRQEFEVADRFTYDSSPHGPKTVLECIQLHANNPEFERDPIAYMKTVQGNASGFESRAIEFINQFIASN